MSDSITTQLDTTGPVSADTRAAAARVMVRLGMPMATPTHRPVPVGPGKGGAR